VHLVEHGADSEELKALMQGFITELSASPEVVE
jgi:hypothetical protein